MGAELQVVDLLDGALQDGRIPAHRLDPALERILRLWNTERPFRWHFQRASRRRGWEKLLQAHPHACLEAPPMLLVAQRHTQDCGMMVCTPARVHTEKGGLPGHWGVDFYVPASQRTRGLGECLLRAWIERSPLALGLGIADPAWSLASRMGWVQVTTARRYVLRLGPLERLWTRGRAGNLPLHASSRAAPPQADSLLRCWNGLPPGIDALLERVRDRLPIHLSRDARWLDWRYPGTRRALQADALSRLQPPRFVGVTLGPPQAPQALAMLELYTLGPLTRVMRIHELLATENAHQLPLLRALISLGHASHQTRLTTRASGEALHDLLCGEGFAVQDEVSSRGEPIQAQAADRFVLNARASAGGAESARSLVTRPWMLSSGDSGNVFLA